VPKVESIRFGEVYEGRFSDYALPELLMGILRGNLTGVLDVILSSERRNAVYFKDGVPVSVSLPEVEARGAARAQIVALFDAGDRSFRFKEGEQMPADAELAILQTLPLIYQGLMAARDRSTVRAFTARTQGSRFHLADTYPRGVDPFEWGEAVERAVAALEEPKSAEDLAARDLGAERAAVVLTCLDLADMLEILEAPKRR